MTITTFDEWLSLGQRTPKEKWNFKQYGDYLLGWRNSMPWAYKGMSVAYDDWAEKEWDNEKNKKILMKAWKMGMALCANSIIINTKESPDYEDKWEIPMDRNWSGRPVSEASSFILEVFLK